MIGLPRLIQQISTLRQMSFADNVDTASTKLSDSISLDFLVDVHSPTNQTNALEKIILHGESKFDLLLLLMSTYIAAFVRNQLHLLPYIKHQINLILVSEIAPSKDKNH